MVGDGSVAAGYLESEDLYKRLKLMGDIDDIITETSPLIAAHNLDLDTVRDALLQEFGAAPAHAHLGSSPFSR
jgi:hypothetical protein